MRRILAIILILFLLCPVVRAEEREKCVALTFDDGPSGRFTRRLLEGLAQRDVKATFLLCGYRLRDYPAVAQAIYDAGHEIGLHGYSHKDMGKMNQADAAREIADTKALLPKGCRPVFLRPPGGSGGPGVSKAAEDAGLALLGWTVDPRDWCNRDAAAVETAVVTSVRGGDIILLHDMSDSSVDAALAIVDKLQRQGFRFVTVSELAQFYDCAPIPGATYNRFS
jgi:peptidoglycan/xylan/chitin deacetylase (PgdA/CDA1 family)